jgi:putative aldouronate transport system permease protein
MRIESKSRKVFNVCNIIFLCLLGVFFLVPYLLILSASFTSEAQFLRHGYSLIPRGLTIHAYVTLFKDDTTIIRAIGNSIFLTVTGTIVHVGTTACAAYPLSKRNFFGRNVIWKILIFSMLFSGGLVPTYMLIISMGLKNNWLALILPGMLSPWNCILIRSYYSTIPSSMEEAVKIDGGNNWIVFSRIYVPMSTPILASIVLFTAVGFWNSWSGPLLYFDSLHRSMWPLTAVVQQMLQENVNPSGTSVGSGYSETVKMAMVVISTLPIIVAYPFVQKYFVKGMMLGSVKE